MGDTEILFASVSPNNAINKTVQWSTSDENVAIVNENGVVTPVSGGIAEITITSVDGGFKASCEVKIPCDNIIPVMTNNTSPSGKASCSSSAYVDINGTLGTSKPYLAFDGDSQTKWESKNDLTSTSFKEWIEYEFDIPISINKYKFIPYDDGNGNYPNTFYLQAYDDISESWINLHSDQNITDPNPKNYSFTNNNKYYKYRLYVTKTNTQTSRIRHIRISTLEMGFEAH